MAEIDDNTDSMSSNSNNAGTCVVCYKNVEIYSIGMCEHPVCYECSTRMRVLCRQNECPICRQDLPKVVFTRQIKPFRHLRKGKLFDERYNIYFDDLEIQEEFTKLLAHVCSYCEGKEVFSSFNSLKDHMRRKHERHYCDLCVENLKIFSFERRCYSRADLAQHRRKGDRDDKSHKGHPLCEFCDCRYMDNDELFRHLRRDHLFCHFCDADGLHQYYSSYHYLREHFRQEHYLCEEGTCAAEQFTSVFRTDIDLKAHKATAHGKHLGKHAAKQARTLELEFAFAPRENRNGRMARSMGVGSRNYNSDHGMGSSSRDTRDRDSQVDDNHVSFDDEPPVARQPDVQSTQEFPSLGNSQTVIPNFNLMKTKGRGNLTIRSSLKGPALAVTDENFPALGLDAAGGNSSGSSSNNNSKTVNLSVYSNKTSAGGVQQRPKSAAPNVSIRVNHNTNGSITTRVSGPNIRIRPSNLSMDSKEFPALGRAEPTTANTTNIGQWTKVTCTKPTISSARANKVAPAPLLNSNTPSPPPMSNCDAFPSLPKSARTKKQSASTAAASSSSTSTFSSTWNRQIGECLDQNTGDAAKNNSKKKKKKKVKQTDNESSAQLSNDKVIDNQFESFSLNNKNDSNNDSHKSDKKKLIKDTAISNKSVSSPSNSSSASASLGSTLKKTNDAPRKRSELQIENLNKTTNELHIADDFTEFDDNSTKGFKSNPPPGFGTTAPPPPGFAVKLINRESDNNDNGLTFTNSSGESYSILPDKSTKLFTYTPPPDFPKRNQDLVARITKVLDQESIEEFRYISGLFRQDLCSAEDYYKHCSDSMGVKEFGSVFSEMLVLLPDIQKQRQLYDVHKDEGGNIILLEICPTCDQVVKIGTDAKAHYSNHSLDSHFPALGRGSGSPLTSNTWRKNT